MSNKLRHILAVLLLWVFFTPTAVKLLDEAFHHHSRFYPKTKNELVHAYHRTCPIPGFTLSFFTAQASPQTLPKQKFFSKVLFELNSALLSSKLNFATLLRAPPLSDGLSPL